jgi:hypothetical protein
MPWRHRLAGRCIGGTAAVTSHSELVLEQLRQGDDFTLYRGREPDAPALLALCVSPRQPQRHGVERVVHEYELAAELDPAWAAKPIALTRHEGRPMLLLEDPGGEPLDQLLQRARAARQPFDLTRVLEVAGNLASSLAHVHARGLIHKDVKPANVLVDDAGRTHLMGFGIASRLLREHQAPGPTELIAGTFAYMAPEQTGRMNRSMDARSDLYSLGVTLYEMLTGCLPFTASDPQEWIHCHIARTPLPPSERRRGLPAMLDAIVLKLLAKNAEDRYQTASGVATDLRACLAAWTACQRIDAFTPGEHDMPGRLLMPERLYGREDATGVLLAAFDRVVRRGTIELVLVSGHAGIGKSSVVNELHRALVPPRGRSRRSACSRRSARGWPMRSSAS